MHVKYHNNPFSKVVYHLFSIGHLVVVGGSDGSHSLCTTEVLDIHENCWKPGPTMTTCRANVAVAVIEDRIWAVGGFSGKFYKNTNQQIIGICKKL